MTGSKRAMASATAQNARWAGLPPPRQLSGRSGQSIQTPACGSNSAGMRKPSALGVVSVIRFAIQISSYMVFRRARPAMSSSPSRIASTEPIVIGR